MMSIVLHAARRAASHTSTWHLADRATQFVAIALQVLVVGAFWGSWIGLGRFMSTISPATFLEIGHVMVAGYGSIMPVLMSLSILATLIAGGVAFRQNPLAGSLILAGFACFVGATAITLSVNVPIDRMIATWTVATLPPDWVQIRNRWETYHTARTVVTLIGLAATLVGSLLPIEHSKGQ